MVASSHHSRIEMKARTIVVRLVAEGGGKGLLCDPMVGVRCERERAGEVGLIQWMG